MTKVGTDMDGSMDELKKPPINPAFENSRIKGEEKERIRDTVKDWASNTSAHGFPNIIRSVHVVRKVFWTLIVLAGCGVTIYQVYDLFVKYYQYPVTISLNMTAVNALQFPSVSICNVNPVRKSMLGHVDQHLTDALPLSFGGNDTSILRSHAARTEIKEHFSAAYTRIDDHTKFKIGHQKQDMILDCAYDGQKCTTENFTWFLNPQFGNCYIFNSGWNGSQVLTSHKSGEEYGLTLELYLEQNEYLPELTESAGIRVSITSQSVMPFPQDDAVQVAPGELTFIGLTMLNISRLQSPYPSDCWDLSRTESAAYSVYSESYEVKYSLPACQKSCYQSHVISQCRCGDATLPMKGQAAMKLSKNITAIVGPCGEDDEICLDEVKLKFTNGKLACECGTPCIEVNYDPKSSSSQWPNDVFAEIYYQEIIHENPHLVDLLQNRNNATNPTHPKSNLAKVQIFFSNLNYEAVDEAKAYTPSSLLADIGGTFGLYLGLSIVALFELIELLFDVARVICCKFYQKK